MSQADWDQLFGFRHAFDHSVTVGITVFVVALLTITPCIIWLLARTHRVDEKLRTELMLRYWSWLVITPLIMVPILLGAAWLMVGVGLLSILCFREYANVTGLSRERAIVVVGFLGIVVLTFAELDHWYNLFVATVPLTVGIIAIAAILRDEPNGYIHRVALGVLGFTLFGSCLGHLGYLANDKDYRPILLLILLAVELNDVFAFMFGKTFGKRKFVPNTSPNKTLAGALGALAATTLLTVTIGALVFRGTELARPIHLVTLGALISVLGQLGDLMLSSIKRDLGIKDMATTIPGHGGLLDRFDSTILVAPAVFHYVNYFVGVGADRLGHVMTGQ